MNAKPQERAEGVAGGVAGTRAGSDAIRVVRLATVDSTNRVAECLIRDGEGGAGVMVVAGVQTGGEGRRAGSGWASPPGGLWATLAWPLEGGDGAAVVLDGLGLRLGMASLRTVASASGGVQPSLKWPNDVVLGARKVCGCMARVLGPDGSGRRWVLAAAGINANNEIPQELRAFAVSLGEACGSERFGAIDLGALEARLREELIVALTGRGLSEDLLAEANRVLAGVGRPIRLRDGGEIIEGTLLGLGSKGTPRVRTDRGIVEASAGAETLRDG